MRQSKLFTKTLKEAPADEEAKNAKLLIRAGYIHKEMAGVYQLLPLGLLVVNKIKQIVREEMNLIETEEMIATNLQSKDLWEKTGRWGDDVVDVWFKTKLKTGTEVGLAWSHEEPLANMMKQHISSYKDLPIFVYQFQNKLRNELRSKSGMMRGREFIMKDAYSFCRNEEDHNQYYEQSKVAYMKCFERMGVGDDTFITFASGGAFTEFSHEFQTICDAGEDICYINKDKGVAINQEVFNDKICADLGVNPSDMEKVKTAEVGNIFNFGRQKGEEVGLFFNEQDGTKTAVWMGSYGIGITRMMGVIVEKFSDDKGIVWPESVAPFRVHLMGIGDVTEETDSLYKMLQDKGIEVLYDDRDMRPGQKFADSDLIGIPIRIVISQKTLEADGYEVKMRNENDAKIVTKDELFVMLSL